MPTPFAPLSPDTPVEAEIESRLLWPVDRMPALSRATPDAKAGGYTRPYGNACLNSRIPWTLPASDWRIRWKKERNPGQSPYFVLQTGDRILLQEAFTWRLLDSEGTEIAEGPLGPSDIVLDPAHHLFYCANLYGALSACHLSDGIQKFMLMALLGIGGRRVLIARPRQCMLVVSTEQIRHPHGAYILDHAYLETIEPGNVEELNAIAVPISSHRLAGLVCDNSFLLAALQEETLVTATLNHLYLFDEDLRLLCDLESKFLPLALSLDEAGRIYLIVQVKEETALWVITPEGELLGECLLPDDFQPGSLPPVVGYDHQVYLAEGRHVLAIHPDGKIAWRQETPAPISGAVITADDCLLVSSGSQLLAYPPEGEPRILHTFEGETLSTPPVLTEQRELLVASPHCLYCLTARPR